MSPIDPYAAVHTSSPERVADPRITGAELRTRMDWLGLADRPMGALLGVRPDTVRRWITGKHPIPYRVGGELEALDQATGRVVGALVGALGGVRDPGVLVYRTDEDLWAAGVAPPPWPAAWWRMVVARAAVAAVEVQGLEVEWA